MKHRVTGLTECGSLIHREEEAETVQVARIQAQIWYNALGWLETAVFTSATDALEGR